MKLKKISLLATFVISFILYASEVELLFSQQMVKDTASLSMYSAADYNKQIINFNKPNGCLEIQTRKVSGTMTFWAEVILFDQLKSSCTIISRPGCHNYLAIAKDRSIKFGIWTISPQRKYLEVFSQTHLKIGQAYRLAGVLEKNAADEYSLVLYVNEKEEARKVFWGKLYPYNEKLFIGASNIDNKKISDLFDCGRILDVKFYQGALDISEISQLKGHVK